MKARVQMAMRWEEEWERGQEKVSETEGRSDTRITVKAEGLRLIECVRAAGHFAF